MKTQTISFKEIGENNNILSAKYYLNDLLELKKYFGDEKYFKDMPYSVIKRILSLIEADKKLKEFKNIINKNEK